MSVGILAAGVSAQETQAAAAPQPCTIHATTFDGFPAEEMSNQWVRLDFVPQLGGRLMQVTFDGHAYLFVNPEFAGKYTPPEQAAGRWINYGGDKIWPLPEGNDDEQHWTGASTPLDDGAYAFSVISQGERCTVRLDGPPDPPTGLQYSREISIGTDSPEIDFHAITKNSTGHSIDWSVQSVSQYDLSDAGAPDGWNHNFWALTPVASDSPYLLGYHVRDGLANDPSYSVRRRHVPAALALYRGRGVGRFRTAVGGSGERREQLHHGGEGHARSTMGVSRQSDGDLLQERTHGGDESPGNADLLRRDDRVKTPYYMEAELNSPMAQLDSGTDLHDGYAMAAVPHGI